MTDLTYNLNGGFKPTTKRFADLSGPDFFPTPAWATFALIDNEMFNGEIWECACGDGSMSRILEQTGNLWPHILDVNVTIKQADRCDHGLRDTPGIWLWSPRPSNSWKR